jgi:hydroxymethylbilane synthase
MRTKLKIGTRDSALAIWQAEFIKSKLKEMNIDCELVFIKSEGEFNLTTALYEFGVEGIFTKALDIALLEKRIDLAVHSLKDVPTKIADSLHLAATPKRGNPIDILVYKEKTPLIDTTYTIATSSLRRKAQWLHQYPNHKIETIRGNINTRLAKLKQNESWDGVIFAAAGVERIALNLPNRLDLNWILPAPAQGVLAVVCREDDTYLIDSLKFLHDSDTALCAKIERDFLRVLLGGCTVPIAAYAELKNQEIYFKGNILTIDGCKKVEVSKIVKKADSKDLGKIAADELLRQGGDEILKTFKQKMEIIK